MPFAEHDNMVKTIPSERPDQPLRISILPWRPWRDRPILYTHCSKPLDDDIAIDAISIANDISWRLLPAIGFGHLTGNPMGARACGHTQPQKLAAGMLQDQKRIQQPKRDRRDYEQIHRRNTVGMIAQKGLPALRRWLPSPRHVFCHGGLPDIDAKLEQFAVNPRCSPKRVRDAHVANELANVRRCLWPATARSRFPAPIGSEPGAVPADYRPTSRDLRKGATTTRGATAIDAEPPRRTAPLATVASPRSACRRAPSEQSAGAGPNLSPSASRWSIKRFAG
jgi:hypothetical protein